MTTRAQALMDEIWHERNTWANTESKLTAAILRKVISHVKTYTASSMNNMQVIDRNVLVIITISKTTRDGTHITHCFVLILSWFRKSWSR